MPSCQTCFCARHLKVYQLNYLGTHFKRRSWVDTSNYHHLLVLIEVDEYISCPLRTVDPWTSPRYCIYIGKGREARLMLSSLSRRSAPGLMEIDPMLSWIIITGLRFEQSYVVCMCTCTDGAPNVQRQRLIINMCPSVAWSGMLMSTYVP